MLQGVNMGKVIRASLIALIFIGIAIFGLAMWGIYVVNNTSPDILAKAESKPSQSAGVRLREACREQVGYRGEDAIERCQAEILGSQIEANRAVEKAIEDEEIRRARDSLN
jgi:hypothetical protein